MEGLSTNKVESSDPNQVPITRTPVRSIVWLIKIAVTASALFVLINAIPWRDWATLQDGSVAPILMNDDATCLIKTNGEPRCFPKGDLRAIEPGVFTLLSQVKLIWLLAYGACAVCMAALLIIRWRFLMSDFEDPPSIRWCGVIWARSQVINLLPLSQIGGDAYRIERASGCLDSTTAAIGVVAAERIVGLFALITIAAAGLGALGWTSANTTTELVVPMVIVTVILTSVLFAARRFVDSRSKINTVKPASWSERLRNLCIPLARLTKRPCAFGIALALSIGSHLLVVLSFFVVDRALGLSTPLWCYLIAIPVLTLARFFPIHIAGIGILEGGLWLFLGRWVNLGLGEVMAVCAGIRILGLSWLALLAISFILPANRNQAHVVEQVIGRKPKSGRDGALVEIGSPECSAGRAGVA